MRPSPRRSALRNSVLAEVLLIAFVCGVGVLIIWRGYSAIELPNVVWQRSQANYTPDVGRLVVRLREPALDPVHFTAVVFPAVHLDALSLAGLAD